MSRKNDSGKAASRMAMANLFGGGGDDSQDALSYQAPRQPSHAKSGSNGAAPAPAPAPAAPAQRHYLLGHVPVLYKYINNAPTPMNDNKICGCLLVEDPAMAPENMFSMLFYDKDKKTTLQVSIKNPEFVAVPLEGNYLRLYDKDGACWSVRFSDQSMQEHACRMISYCRAFLAAVQKPKDTNATFFDLNVAKTKGSKVADGTTARITYSAYPASTLTPLIPQGPKGELPPPIASAKEPKVVTLGSQGKEKMPYIMMDQAMLGMRAGDKRLMVLPPSPGTTDRLLVEVEVVKIKPKDKEGKKEKAHAPAPVPVPTPVPADKAEEQRKLEAKTLAEAAAVRRPSTTKVVPAPAPAPTPTPAPAPAPITSAPEEIRAVPMQQQQQTPPAPQQSMALVATDNQMSMQQQMVIQQQQFQIQNLSMQLHQANAQVANMSQAQMQLANNQSQGGGLSGMGKQHMQQVQLGMLTTEGKLLEVDGKLKTMITAGGMEPSPSEAEATPSEKAKEAQALAMLPHISTSELMTQLESMLMTLSVAHAPRASNGGTSGGGSGAGGSVELTAAQNLAMQLSTQLQQSNMMLEIEKAKNAELASKLQKAGLN